MDRLTRWVLGHRLVVVLVWLAVALAGGATATTTVDRLSYEFALPGQPAYEANQEILERFGSGGADDPLLFVARGDGAEETVAGLADAALQQVPGSRVATAADPGAQALVADDGGLAVAVVYPPVAPGPEPYAASEPRLEALAAQARAGGADVQLTGFVQLAEGGGGDRGVLLEVVLGGLGALVVLALVFGSLLAILPLVVAAVAILGTYLALLGLTAITDVSFVVQYLVALIGLGVAIDYTLLVVTRWREERDDGSDNEEAVRTAMRTAGRSVALQRCHGRRVARRARAGPGAVPSQHRPGRPPHPAVQRRHRGDAGPGSAEHDRPAAAVAPSQAGGRPQPRLGTARPRGSGAPVAHRGPRGRGPAGPGPPALTLTLGSPQLSGLASSSPQSQAATAAVDAGVPPGVLRPTEVLVPDDAARTVEERLAAVDGVAAVAVPSGDEWQGGGARLLQVWSADDPASDAGRATLERVRSTAAGVDGVSVGGSPAEDADFVSAVYGNVGWLVLAVVLLTFLLLAHALRSLWLPVKALVLNVVSISAAYGVTVLIWQDGFGTELLFGQPATGVVTTWVPIAAFCFLFGLSMDYEVFILSRMREAYDEHGDTDRAAVDGIAHTGRLVTSAALILFLAFVALATVPSVDVKILATTLALGILIDAVVIRGLLAPALVGVLGPLNWVLPRWLAVLVRVPVDPHRSSLTSRGAAE